MKLLDFFKKSKKEAEKPKLTSQQKMVREGAIRLHRIRIENLSEEFEELSAKLESLESDFGIPRTLKEKESDLIIRRMSLLKYEIEIREGLVKWLS